MKGDNISETQLCALFWAGLMAPAAELLPGIILPIAGACSWLTALAALPILLVVSWWVFRLGQGGLARGMTDALGRWLGRGVLLLYILWGEFLVALRLRLCAQRLLSAGERDGSLWFFLPAAALLALWMARGKLAALARAGQIFLGVLVVTAAVVLGLSLSKVCPEYLLPLWWVDTIPVLKGSIGVWSVLGYGVFAAFLLGDVKPTPHSRRDWVIWCTAGCVLLAVEQAVVIGNLGASLAQHLDSPFFVLAKSVGVEGAFQRVESVVAALWTFADLVQLGVLLFAIWKMVEQMGTGANQKTTATVAVLVGAVIALGAFSDGIWAEWAGRTIAPLGNLVFGMGIPLLAGLIALLKGKGRVSADRLYKEAQDIGKSGKNS